jgi:hypothetical protein
MASGRIVSVDYNFAVNKSSTVSSSTSTVTPRPSLLKWTARYMRNGFAETAGFPIEELATGKQKGKK